MDINNVDAVLDPGDDVNPDNCWHNTIDVGESAAGGCSTCVEKLIQVGADINKGTKTPLIYAAENGRTKCLKVLLKAGADVNKSDEFGTALKYAICSGSYDCAYALSEAGADVNNGNLLYYAASYNRFKCEELLIKSGVDVNLPCKDGCAIIFMAAEENRTEFVKLLLQAGAKINTKNKLGQNALTNYIAKGKPVKENMCTLLLAAGETVDVTTLKRRSRFDRLLEEVSVPDFLLYESFTFSLKGRCRQVIRKHLLDLDPHKHLFYRVPTLDLPPTLSAYLLYNMTTGQPITVENVNASEAALNGDAGTEDLTSLTETIKFGHKKKKPSKCCCCTS